MPTRSVRAATQFAQAASIRIDMTDERLEAGKRVAIHID